MSITKHAKAARDERTSMFKTALLLTSIAMAIGLLFSAMQDARGADAEDSRDSAASSALMTAGDDS